MAKFKTDSKEKGHPKVPKLDFKKIFEWRERKNQKALNGQPDTEVECDVKNFTVIDFQIDDEAGLQEGNDAYFPKGSNLVTDKVQKEELDERKKFIVAILNRIPDEKEGSHFTILNILQTMNIKNR